MAKASREIIRENYDGIQVLNFKNRAPNLHSILQATTQKFPEKNALECHAGVRTYEQFVEDVDRFGAAMQETMGVTKGDRVALLLGNDLGFPIAFFAAVRIGAVAVPINTRSVAKEIAYIVNNSGARVVVVDPPNLKEFARSRKSTPDVEHVVLTAPSDGATEYLQLDSILQGPPRKPEEIRVEEGDLACIFYTAGTMGAPKGALCTHRNLVSNALNTQLVTGGSPDSRALICVPLCHPTGCHSQLISGIHNGGTSVIQRHFNADETLSLIGKSQITSLVGVPTMYWLMLAQMKLKDYSLNTLQNVSYGGAPASPELVRRLREVFPTARLGNGYGLTETSALATFLPDEYAMEKPDSVGPPVPTVEIRIVDDEGNNLVPGKIGEILFKGPSVVSGYWEDTKASEEAFTNGWFHTGDLGRVDSEGFLSIVDRKKDMIIRGGENIYCVEIENLLESHPSVFQAAVVGEPDKVFGEHVKAYIVSNPGCSLSVDEILDFCDEHLADFKVPKYVEFVDNLPRNPAGKVDKRMLRR